MSRIHPLLKDISGRKPRLAIFLSGSGSNAEEILKRIQENKAAAPCIPAALVTDAPLKSRARELAELYDVPVIENDIRNFYREHGETRVSIGTERGQAIRRAWTDELRVQLQCFKIDFAVFAGFVPLTNLTAHYPCLNVHPGDLTYTKNGRRYLVGLHTIPIERAILEGLEYLRSSVIQALPYTGKGDDMDSGPILGISPEVPVALNNFSLQELREIAAARPERRPVGGYKDKLEEIAVQNQERLKEQGDWIVLPPVVFDFARGKFAVDDEGQLNYLIGEKWHAIQTVIYGKNQQEILFAER